MTDEDSHIRPFFLYLLAIAVIFAGISFPARAGFLSVVGEILKSPPFSAVEIKQPIVNSQNIALLQAACNSDPNPLKNETENLLVGGIAFLPQVGPAGTLADIEEPQTEQIQVYVVQSGDTLSEIADKFGVSMNTILWANDLTSKSKIKEGDTLVVLPISGIRHVVKKGETLSSIAKLYHGDTDEIANYNGIAPSKLAIGTTIIIPHGDLPMSAERAKTVVSNTGESVERPTYAGYFIRPVRGGSRTQGLHGNNAVDLQTCAGDDILAAAEGKVIVAENSGYNGGYGKYVVISHPNGTQTLYAHLQEVIVSVGQPVAQSQVIGYEGNTGLTYGATGVHLHFEVRGAQNPF